jgi:hypothetical protein
MNRKKQILDLLDLLKSAGISRSKIEEELHYSENYIDQLLTKGGNDRFYQALKRYKEAVFESIAKDNIDVKDITPSEGLYQSKYIKQLEKENQYLQKIVETNLMLVLATVRTISVRQRAVGEVVLHSLEKIEKKSTKSTGALLAAADRQIDQIEREAYAHDSED